MTIITPAMTSTTTSIVFCSILLAVTLFSDITHALVCYENDESGNVYEASNSSWTYCALIPPIASRPEAGRVFGVSPAGDWTEAYDYTFAMTDKVYKILTICILEKYDFGQLSPKYVRGASEFLFRCVCNYDRCNSATTFSAYINAVQMENTSSSSNQD